MLQDTEQAMLLHNHIPVEGQSAAYHAAFNP